MESHEKVKLLTCLESHNIKFTFESYNPDDWHDTIIIEWLPLGLVSPTELALYLSQRAYMIHCYRCFGRWFLQDKPIDPDELRKYIFDRLIAEYQDYQRQSENPMASDILSKCETVEFQLAVMKELEYHCRIRSC